MGFRRYRRLAGGARIREYGGDAPRAPWPEAAPLSGRRASTSTQSRVPVGSLHGVATGAMSDQQAFLDATLPHLEALWGIARRSCHSHGEAEDLVQETFLRAFAAFDRHRGGDVRAWLAAICLNTHRSSARPPR